MFFGQRNNNRTKLVAQVGAVIVIFLFVLWLAQFAKDSESVRELVFTFGYPGIFVISLISGFNILVPIPASSFVPLFFESGLNIWITIVIMTLGLTIADLIGFIIGRVGRTVTSSWNNKKIILRLENLCQKNYWFPVVFLFMYASLVPAPNEIVVIPLAFIGYKAKHLLAPVFLGNLFFNIWTSFGIIGAFSLI